MLCVGLGIRHVAEGIGAALQPPGVGVIAGAGKRDPAGSCAARVPRIPFPYRDLVPETCLPAVLSGLAGSPTTVCSAGWKHEAG
jgi:hypothetical protein